MAEEIKTTGNVTVVPSICTPTNHNYNMAVKIETPLGVVTQVLVICSKCGNIITKTI